MWRGVVLASLVLFVGCATAQRMDRAALDQRYQDTQLAEGTLSIVPLRLDADAQPPKVVNWFYAGTDGDQHQLVLRILTWGDQSQPVGQEQRYEIARDQLTITTPLPATNDESRWLPLYEATGNAIAPPPDLPTKRQAPDPIISDPIRVPDDSVVPIPAP